MRHPDWESELEWFQTVKGEIRNQLEASQGILLSEGAGLRGLWKEIREETAFKPADDSGDDEWFLRSEIRRQEAFHRNAAENSSILAKALETPYFGRVDFTEDGTEPLRIYVGIKGIREKSSPFPMVYDWRAPISTLFYDADSGPASYSCDAGEISGQVTLKRQYGIEAGELKSMFDADMKIDDEILKEALSRTASRHMRTIVQTIQRHQNKAIRDEGHKLLIVEGPAGSGKTSVALHRAAYLLYRDRDSSPGVLILSPNIVFSEYIARVLPELGEDGTEQLTFTEYADKRLPIGLEPEGLSGQLDRLANNPGLETAILTKGTLDFARALEDFIHRYSMDERVAEEIRHGDHVIISREELDDLLHSPASNYPLGTRLNHIRARIQPILKALMRERRRQLIAEVKESSEEFLITHEITAKAREALAEEFEPVNALLDRLLGIDLPKLYLGFLGYMGMEPGLPIFPDRIGKEVILAYEDVSPILLMQGILFGFKSLIGVTHVVVDEVQDYSPLQLYLLGRIFPGRSFTLVGDMGQALGADISLGSGGDLSWTRGALGLSGTESSHIRFTKVYRSTKEIADFAGHLLSEDGVEAEPLERSGLPPRIFPLPAGSSAASTVPALVLSEAERYMNEGFKSVAIICGSTDEAQDLHKAMNGKPMLLAENDPDLTKPVIVTPIGLVKGLEFDAVILLCPDTADMGVRARRFLYTGATRALHRLSIFMPNSSLQLLSAIGTDLYTGIE